MNALGFQLAIKLLNESFQRRTLELEPELANGLGEYLLKFRSGFLEITHWAIQSSIPRRSIWHSKAYRICRYYFGHGCGRKMTGSVDPACKLPSTAPSSLPLLLLPLSQVPAFSVFLS